MILDFLYFYEMYYNYKQIYLLQEKKYKVIVTFSSSGNNDLSVVEEIIDFLTRSNVSFTCNDADGAMDSLETKWQIFVLSYISIKDKNIEDKFNEAMSISIRKNQVQVGVLS